MWGTQTSKFHDFRILEPRGTLIYGFKIYQITSTNIRKYGHMFENVTLANLIISKLACFGTRVYQSFWNFRTWIWGISNIRSLGNLKFWKYETPMIYNRIINELFEVSAIRHYPSSRKSWYFLVVAVSSYVWFVQTIEPSIFMFFVLRTSPI